ncbi:MAG TPA: M14 family zinc carboxypeptidase [Longimicrobiales bacterium]
MSLIRSGVAALLLTLVLFRASVAQSVPSPEEYFGFAMGTSGQLARWDGIVEYFEVVAAGSDRIRVDTLGPSTLGNPFVVVTLSSPENLARWERIVEDSKTLARGRVARPEAEALARDLPATVVINHNIHSTEIASSQTSVELVHRLATGDEEDVLSILEGVVTLLIPSTNPDGQIMVTDWYRRIADTETPRARMPWLYHPYAGHDNNRDFFQGALVETRYWFEVMFHRSAAQIYLDQHQMGGSGARMFVPPYPDPMNPLVHPLLWRSTQFLGGGIVRDLQAAGRQGIISGTMYRIFGQEGALTQRYHNVVGLLTETASANLASPDTVSREALERGQRGGAYEFSMAMPDPWWGGEWTLGDIVENQTIAALSVLTQAARYREELVLGRWQMASETMERVRERGPYGFVIPLGQGDDLTAADLVHRLRLQGIEVHRATSDFVALPTVRDTVADVAGIRRPWTPEVAGEGEAGAGEGGATDTVTAAGDAGTERDEAGDDVAPGPQPRSFTAGSWVVLAAQPDYAALMDLLEPRFLPVRREYPGGPFLRMYDAAAYTMAMQMGVEAVRVDVPFEAALTAVADVLAPPLPPFRQASRWYALSPEVNASYRAVNGLLATGVAVRRARDAMELAGRSARGVLLVPADQPGIHAIMADVAADVPVWSDPAGVPSTQPVEAARVGLYQGWAASMDEGWTRLFLEEFDVPHVSLMDEDVRDPDLRSRVDVVVLPSEMSLNRLIDGTAEGDAPEEYVGGIGEEGVENLKAFVRGGGTLVTLDQGDRVVLERFDVPVADALQGVGGTDFFLPASLLAVELSQDHDLTAGSPEATVAKWAGGRAYEPTGWEGEAGAIRVVGRWASDPARALAAGQLVGAEHLAGKGAILDVTYGQGRILMYGFRVQHRMQTHGTFKLLLNAFLHAGRPIMEDG